MFKQIDNYQILIYDQAGYMSLNDIIKLLKGKEEKIKSDLESRVDNNQDRIIYLDDDYYSLDLIILYSFDYDYKIAFKLYDLSLNENIVINDFVVKTINEEKESLNKLNDILESNKDLIKTFCKLKNVGQEERYFENINHISLESVQILIGLLKEKFDFGSDFGVVRDYSLLMEILYYSNSITYENDLKEIEFDDNEDDVCYIVKTMYNIIKKKPFVSGNELIATFIVYYYLDQSNLIFDDGNRITTLTDISFACGLIINSSDNNIVTTLKKVKSLFAKNYVCLNKELNDLSPIKDSSKEGVINYIISSIEGFKGYKKYHDYFKGKSIVYKVYYFGCYNNFFLDKGKTFLSSKKTLFFKGTLYCYSDAPLGLENREEFLKDIIDEIKIRCYSDLIVPFLDKIKNKVKPYFDLDSLSIEFDFDIKTKFEED